MSETRRDFLKFVLAGSVAAGCPIDLSALAPAGPATPQLDGEHYDICHQVRDGFVFERPPVLKHYDVVIVGGGVSGLSAAYFLQQHNFLLLEKEPHWGGNAYLETYDGQAFATGSAFDFKDSSSDQLAREIGLNPLAINSPDPTIVNGKWVADTWRTGLDELPYSPAIRESFKKFRKEIVALDPDKDAEHLDSFPLTQILKNYPPEITQWWDGYGPSNWGAKSADTSTLVAVIDLKEMAGDDADPRVTLPGGNGALAQRLAEILQKTFADHILAGATTVAVEPQKDEIHVTYIHDGQLRTVAAKFVIMATPKFITARLVSGLPDAQLEAMSSIRYCPYPVINMIFDRSIYNKAYDTWCPGISFSDFVVADWTTSQHVATSSGGRPVEAAFSSGFVGAGLRPALPPPGRPSILTFYTPMPIIDRAKLLTDDGCRKIAANVLHDFKNLLPEFNVDPIELHFYRRGHPMFLPTPGTFTKTIPAASRQFDRIYFANTDSVGPVSDIAASVEVSRRAAEQIEKRMSGA